MPEVEQDALQIRRGFKHDRPGLAEIDVAHRVDHVGVGRGDERFSVEAFLPDRQNVVTSPKTFSDPSFIPIVLTSGMAHRYVCIAR